MREIKFRAWDKYNKTMWYSGEHEESINNCKFDIFFDIETHELKAAIIKEIDVGLPKMMYDEYDLPLMQYTGLKDRNGKEIYEGDILLTDGDEFGDIYSTVVFEKGAFYVKEEGYPVELLLSDLIEDCEVCGNIFENPELLEMEESK
jgi:uncharacterized phage protein (TIGR01671 family)